MRRRAIGIGIVAVLGGCVGAAPGGSGDDVSGDDVAADAGPGDPDGGGVDPCATPVAIATSGRPIDLMPPARLAEIATRLPCVVSGELRDVLESADTIFYDKHSLTPGYQDSFGDNVIAPIGMRPNTIDPELINLAVPGGHAWIFQSVGTFEFPFGKPIGPASNVVVVDFWHVPRQGGAILPVVWWRRDPSSLTHRYEWMFPAGTVFGEMIFLDEGGALHPFEIRSRTRAVDGWNVDVYRPFPRAIDLADAIDARRGDRPDWTTSAELDAVAAALADGSLSTQHVASTHFGDAFPPHDGGLDVLPTTTGAAAELIHELLRTSPFHTSRGVPWKQDGALTAWAASAAGAGAIVPPSYNAGVVEVSEASCDTCHRDAGRPFETWYEDIIAYGELWGNDETFTWHPFEEDAFVDDNGEVVDFNYDNREMRADMTSAGLLAPYRVADHPATTYVRIVREWTDFTY